MTSPWVSGGFASGPVSPWRGPSFLSVDINGANPAAVIPEDLFYRIGDLPPWSNPTDGIHTQAFASTSEAGDVSEISGRTSSIFYTNNAADQWIAVDFDPQATGQRVNLDGLFFQHGSWNGGHRIQSFAVEAGVGSTLGSAIWTLIATVSDPNFLPNSGYSWSDFLPLITQPAPYRFLRLRMSGINSVSERHLMISELLLGGKLYLGT